MGRRTGEWEGGRRENGKAVTGEWEGGDGRMGRR